MGLIMHILRRGMKNKKTMSIVEQARRLDTISSGFFSNIMNSEDDCPEVLRVDRGCMIKRDNIPLHLGFSTEVIDNDTGQRHFVEKITTTTKRISNKEGILLYDYSLELGTIKGNTNSSLLKICSKPPKFTKPIKSNNLEEIKSPLHKLIRVQEFKSEEFPVFDEINLKYYPKGYNIWKKYRFADAEAWDFYNRLMLDPEVVELVPYLTKEGLVYYANEFAPREDLVWEEAKKPFKIPTSLNLDIKDL